MSLNAQKNKNIDTFIEIISKIDDDIIDKDYCKSELLKTKEKMNKEKKKISPKKGRQIMHKDYKIKDRISRHLNEEREEKKRQQEELIKFNKEHEMKDKELNSDSDNEDNLSDRSNKKEENGNDGHHHQHSNSSLHKGTVFPSSIKKTTRIIHKCSSNKLLKIQGQNSAKIMDEEEKKRQILFKRIERKNKVKRVLLFCAAYLESNCILPEDYFNNSPIQKVPFEYKYSAEFLDAVKFNDINKVNDLLKCSKNYLFSFDYYHQTGYHWAAKNGNYDILQILCEAGRPVNQIDIKNRTPLYLASLNNHLKCVELLFSYEANPLIGDIKGKRPVDVCDDINIKVLIGDKMETKYINHFFRELLNAKNKKNDEKNELNKKEEELLKKNK